MGVKYLIGTEFQLGMTKQFWKWTVAMVAQHLHVLKLTEKCAFCVMSGVPFFFLRNVFIYGKFAIFQS